MALLAAPIGCSAGTSRGASHTAKVQVAPQALVEIVTPSRLFPDLDSKRKIAPAFASVVGEGEQRLLIDRMRLSVRDDGSLQRASELFPTGSVNEMELPSRLGGGFAFFVRSGGGTPIWRADDWLGKLHPVVTLSSDVREVIPGFDRLYVRTMLNGRLFAIDPASGDPVPLGPLPAAASYGALAFADGWRAVVDTDLRGPLATFDAGASWRALGINERVVAVTARDGVIAVDTALGRYTVDARGGLLFSPIPAGGRGDGAREAAKAGPLGKSPLRAAVEDGWPDSATTAVVARGGSLVRVSLTDGSIVATKEDAYPDRRASCHAIRVGASFGFLCGERESATVVYEWIGDLAVREALRFSAPRFVAASGNGALVIRGGCSDDAAPADAGRTYCVRSAEGALRDIRIKGDLGVERVVALQDGRVAVIVPPRGASAGQLSIIEGAAAKTVTLKLPEEPKNAAREAQRGMWLEGFEERERGVLAGWVESGGPVVGLRIALDGTVTAGEPRDAIEGGSVMLSSRFALAFGPDGRASESSDGGMTWRDFDLSMREDASPTRTCGPVGCSVAGWTRVGWGPPPNDDDAVAAEPGTLPAGSLKTVSPPWFRCEVLGSVTPPLPEKLAKAAPQPPPRMPRLVVRPRGMGAPTPTPPGGWVPFRNVAPPPLGKEEIGYDAGDFSATMHVRAYTWGKRGAEWSRVGRFVVRFDDRFDPTGGVRSSAISSSPWADEAAAVDAVLQTYGTGWQSMIDPSGKATLARACRGNVCTMYAVADGQAITPVRDATGHLATIFALPGQNGTASQAVRLGETWFLLGLGGQAYDAAALYRVDLGQARQLATYQRVNDQRYDWPRLVRRALGGGLGLLVAGAPDIGERVGIWFVYPIDPDTGELGDAVPLVRRDFDRVPLAHCAPDRDGWVLEDRFSGGGVGFAHIDVEGYGASLDPDVEYRVRLDGGSACIDAISTNVQGTFTKAKDASQGAAKPSDDAIPFVATERATGRRWSLACTRKRSILSR
jgi:hypothetical protein